MTKKSWEEEGMKLVSLRSFIKSKFPSHEHKPYRRLKFKKQAEFETLADRDSERITPFFFIHAKVYNENGLCLLTLY
jgi:hypothetical protein